VSASGLSFKDLILRVAEFRGWANYAHTTDDQTNRAKIPTDPNQLDKCKRAVNDAMVMVAAANTSAGGWSCLRQTIELRVTIDGLGPDNYNRDPSMLLLPQEVPTHWEGHITFKPDGSETTVPLAQIEESRVRAILNANNTSGYPIGYSKQTVRLTQEGAGHSRWALHIAPNPSQAGTITATVRTVVVPLAAMDDRHPFGPAMDQFIVAACLWASVQHDATDKDRWERSRESYREQLALALELETENQAHVISRDHHMASGEPVARVKTPIYINDVLVNPD